MADDLWIVRKLLKQSVEQKLAMVQKRFAHAGVRVTYLKCCAF